MATRASASARARALLLPAAGLAVALAVWWGLVHGVGQRSPMAARFSPEATLAAGLELLRGPELRDHALASLRRVGLGLLLAVVLGVPLGLLAGSWKAFSAATSTLFQLLRMISPLAWMPVAVMALGVGEAPVVFLVSFAALWPIALNVAAGVAAIEPQWLTLADSLGASRRERLLHVTVPAIAAHLLTGVRLAIGIVWVVLVPAEMLGVSAGLGYLVLDTRDRMAYGELMATIVFIGLLGFVLDGLARAAHRRWAGTSRPS